MDHLLEVDIHLSIVLILDSLQIEYAFQDKGFPILKTKRVYFLLKNAYLFPKRCFFC